MADRAQSGQAKNHFPTGPFPAYLTRLPWQEAIGAWRNSAKRGGWRLARLSGSRKGDTCARKATIRSRESDIGGIGKRRREPHKATVWRPRRQIGGRKRHFWRPRRQESAIRAFHRVTGVNLMATRAMAVRPAEKHRLLPAIGEIVARPLVSRRADRPVLPLCAGPLISETSAGGAWRCCQSNRNSSPIDRALPCPAEPQVMSDCHSARAAERRAL
jgi:hypothetical protein